VTGYEEAVDRSAKGVEAVLDAAEWHDKLSIREVIEQYMRWNDDGDFTSIVGLFAEDATFQFFGRVLVGREAIAEFFAGTFPPPPRHWTEGGSLFVEPRSIHISSNPIITVTGDAATAETDFQVVQRSADGHAQVTLVGRYRDRFRRDLATGRWLIECRTGVSVARPGEEGTDAEWRRAIERMDPETKGTLQT
jgi:uncharacterized protein (TIGR02246 family)